MGDLFGPAHPRRDGLFRFVGGLILPTSRAKGLQLIRNCVDRLELDWGNPEWEEIKKLLDDTSDELCFSDLGARHDLTEMTADNCVEAGLGLLVEQAFIYTLDKLQQEKKDQELKEHLRRMEEAEKELMDMFEEEEKKKKEQQEKDAVKK